MCSDNRGNCGCRPYDFVLRSDFSMYYGNELYWNSSQQAQYSNNFNNNSYNSYNNNGYNNNSYNDDGYNNNSYNNYENQRTEPTRVHCIVETQSHKKCTCFSDEKKNVKNP